MQAIRIVTSFGILVVSLALLGGCSGGGSTLPANQSGTGFQQSSNAARLGTKGRRYVFASDYLAKAVDIFRAGQQIGQITGFNEPEGLATDRSGNLYVANTDDRNIEEFAPPYDGAPIATISDPDGAPTAVAVSRSGLVAVINICNGGKYYECTLPSTAHFYAKGNFTSPCATISIFQTGLSGAFDDHGALYVGGLSRFERAQVGIIRGGCRAKAVLGLTPQYMISFPGGIQVDTNDNVAVLDSLSNQVDLFAPLAKDSTMLTLISTAALNDTAQAVTFALTADGKDFYVADFASHQTEEYAYPAGGSSIGILQSNPTCDCEGVAVAPAEFP